MKLLKTVCLFILLMPFIFSCEASNKLVWENVFFEINTVKSTRTEFIHGENICFKFAEVKGFQSNNDNVFPGLSILVLNSKNDTVHFVEDDFCNLTEGIPLKSLNLKACINAVHDPNCEQYTVRIKIWDKLSSKSRDFSMPFTVDPNRLLEIVQHNLTFSDIYLWNQTKGYMIVENQIFDENQNVFIMDGLSGFKIEENKVFPLIEMEVLDSLGGIVIKSENILGKLANVGVEPEILRQKIPLALSFDHVEFSNPCLLKVKITDLRSKENIIEVSGVLNIK